MWPFHMHVLVKFLLHRSALSFELKVACICGFCHTQRHYTAYRHWLCCSTSVWHPTVLFYQCVTPYCAVLPVCDTLLCCSTSVWHPTVLFYQCVTPYCGHNFSLNNLSVKYILSLVLLILRLWTCDLDLVVVFSAYICLQIDRDTVGFTSGL